MINLIKMVETFYFDTSIWLDFFENRDEPNLPKGRLVHELLNKITRTDAKVIYSDHNIFELVSVGYSPYEINDMFKPLKLILIFIEATEKEIRKAKDLATKRNIPKGDALHALITRDNKAILVTLDKHFKEVPDIIKPKRPQDLI